MCCTCFAVILFKTCSRGQLPPSSATEFELECLSIIYRSEFGEISVSFKPLYLKKRGMQQNISVEFRGIELLFDSGVLYKTSFED